MSKRTKIDQIELLEELGQQLKKILHVGEKCCEIVEKAVHTESDRLKQARVRWVYELNKAVARLDALKFDIFSVIQSRNSLQLPEDLDAYRSCSDELARLRLQLEACQASVKECKDAIAKIDNLLDRLNYQRSQYSSPERNLKTVLSKTIPRAINNAEIIHGLFMDYISVESDMVGTIFTENYIEEYAEKKAEKAKKEKEISDQKDKVNDPRDVFSEINIQKIGGEKCMLVGLKKSGKDFNGSTITNIENEAISKSCRFVRIDIYTESADFFAKQGYMIRYRDPTISWSGCYALKDMSGEEYAKDHEVEIIEFDKIQRDGLLG